MLHADLTLLLHTHQVADGACFLFTPYTCCMQVLPLLLRTCVAGGTAYPYGAWDCLCYCRLVSQRDCLPTLAFHVNVYALITPPPWSIVSFFRPPLQRSPSVVTLASTYCSFPVCGDRQEFRESPVVRPERACLSFAVLLYLPPLRRAARPRSESSVGDPVIICLLFHLPHLYGTRPKRASLSLPFCAICPDMARGPSSERALRRRPSYHLPFVSFTHLYGARPERASFSLPLCPIIARDPSGPAYHYLSVQFAPVMARGPSSERALRGQPSYHLPFVLFAHLYSARPEPASLSLPSAQFAPVMARGPSSERALRRRPVIICLLFHLPTFMARGPSGPAFHCLFAQFSPVMVCGRSRPTYHCLSVQFAPVMARGLSSERALRRRPVIICLLFQLPTFMAHGLSGPAFHCLSAQFSPVMARGPSGPAYHCLSA